MANTTFTDNSTLIVADFMNDVNDTVYEVLGDGVNVPATAADVRTNIGLGTIATQNSNNVTITGGTIPTSVLTGPVALANGGTGGTDAATARASLGTAALGANSDITSLSGLTTPLSKAQGGTGAITSKTLVQQVSTFVATVATGTTQIPADDTIPQITEGDQYISRAITPANAANELEVEVEFCGSNSVNNYLSIALFRDAGANAVASRVMVAGASTLGSQKFTYYVTAGSTSATTFTVRAGPSGASTVTLNGTSGSRLFGGVVVSSIVIKEYTP